MNNNLAIQSRFVGWIVYAFVVVVIYRVLQSFGPEMDVPWAHVIFYFPYFFPLLLVAPASKIYMRYRMSKLKPNDVQQSDEN